MTGESKTIHFNPHFPDGRKIDDPSITIAELKGWIEQLERDGSAPHYLTLVRDCLNRRCARSE